MPGLILLGREASFSYFERKRNGEFSFFGSLSRLFLLTYFVKSTQTLLNLNSREPYSSSESEIKFRRCLFTFSLNYEIRHFHVVVVQKRQRNVQKSVPHVQSCCFSYLSYYFLDVLFAIEWLNLKVPNNKRKRPRSMTAAVARYQGNWAELIFAKTSGIVKCALWTGENRSQKSFRI